MAKYYSTGLRNKLASGMPLNQALHGARMVVYSSSQTSDADTGVATSNILATLTSSGSALTGETRAQWKATIGGTSGYVNAMVLGHEIFSGTTDAAGSGTTIKLTGGSATDDYYNGMYVIVTDHTGAGDVARITDYDGTSKVATVSAINGTSFTTQASTYGDFIVVSGVELMGARVANTGTATGTGTAVLTQINANLSGLEVSAVAGATADIILLYANTGTGVSLNGMRLYAASVTTTVTIANATGQPANGPFVVGTAQSGGMTWSGAASSGQVAMIGTLSTGSGTSYGAAASSSKAGTMASWRILVDPADDGSTSSTEYARIDGNFGTLSTNDIQVSSTTRTQGDPITISAFPVGFKYTTSS